MVGVKMIQVEVAYARPDEQVIIPVQVAEGADLEQAVILAKIQERFPEIDLATAKVGIFGKLSQLSTPLRAGDRVEIYRPLRADPKAVRRRRAAEWKSPQGEPRQGGDCAPPSTRLSRSPLK